MLTTEAAQAEIINEDFTSPDNKGETDSRADAHEKAKKEEELFGIPHLTDSFFSSRESL